MQEILKSSRSSRCSEKSGWFLAGTEDRIRDIITELINQQMASQRVTEMAGLHQVIHLSSIENYVDESKGHFHKALLAYLAEVL